MVRARAIYCGGGTAEVAAGPCSLTVERRDTDGRRWSCPVELLAASLASCITLTLAAVADSKGIKFNSLEVEVEVCGEERRISAVIRVGGNLTEREMKILLNSAKHCEVSKLLKEPVAFELAFTRL